ncbi:MAG: hypothetical protein CL840_10785 [Crocinitomicaceae bacterium]|nr:hypothetical protein [Crocinitomicaceae bacterium]|tara:strand:- start:28344 stop:28874 length:531 start_codon:yes stop_codon:yes gene_type:complete
MTQVRIKLFLLMAVLGLLLLIDSCKKKDDSFEPIQVVGVEDKLVGTWNVISTEGVGVVKIAGKDVQVTGKNKDEPQGFYELKKSPNEYTYDVKATLEMDISGIKQNYDYNDHDAGTWTVSEDEKSVIFAGNQGITQTLFFTQYDSNENLYMRIAIPVDTTFSSFEYKGTVFVNMRK